MNIQYYENAKTFKLDTPNTSYMIGIVDEEKFIGHMYYGKKVSDEQLEYLLRIKEGPFVPSENNRDRLSFLDAFPMEYPTHGLGDFRTSAFEVKTNTGHRLSNLTYQSHEIYGGKPQLKGLPATFGDENDCSTLELPCIDHELKLDVKL